MEKLRRVSQDVKLVFKVGGMMFINCSNHKSESWAKEQINAVKDLGETVIVDYDFPEVSAEVSEEQIIELAETICSEILEKKPNFVMCQGEFTLTYRVVNELKKNGIKVVAACSQREAYENIMPNGAIRKDSVYQFVRFREYI